MDVPKKATGMLATVGRRMSVKDRIQEAGAMTLYETSRAESRAWTMARPHGL